MDVAAFCSLANTERLETSGHEMLRFIAASLIIIYLVVCARQIAPAQQETSVRQTQQVYLYLMYTLDECVLQSARSNYKRSGDPAIAVERGFIACDAEERAFKNQLASGISPTFAAGEVDNHRYKLKKLLVEMLPGDHLKTMKGQVQ